MSAPAGAASQSRFARDVKTVGRPIVVVVPTSRRALTERVGGMDHAGADRHPHQGCPGWCRSCTSPVDFDELPVYRSRGHLCHATADPLVMVPGGAGGGGGLPAIGGGLHHQSSHRGGPHITNPATGSATRAIFIYSGGARLVR